MTNYTNPNLKYTEQKKKSSKKINSFWKLVTNNNNLKLHIVYKSTLIECTPIRDGKIFDLMNINFKYERKDFHLLL